MTASSDVLVIGSGPLGAAAARRLAESGRSVLILEQGPPITDPPGSHVRNAPRFTRDPDAYLEIATKQLAFFDDTVPRTRLPGAAVTNVQGGQGVIWTDLCPRGDAPWDALTPAEWDRYYGIAERYLGVQAEWFELVAAPAAHPRPARAAARAGGTRRPRPAGRRAGRHAWHFAFHRAARHPGRRGRGIGTNSNRPGYRR